MTLLRPYRTKLVCCEIERSAAAEKNRYFFLHTCTSIKMYINRSVGGTKATGEKRTKKTQMPNAASAAL